MHRVDADPVIGRGALHRNRFCEQTDASFGGAVAGQSCRPAEADNRRHDNNGVNLRSGAGGKGVNAGEAALRGSGESLGVELSLGGSL